MNQKKAFYIIVTGIVILVILLGGYFWLSSKKEQAGGEGDLIDYLPFGTSQRGNLPIVKPGTKDPITQEPVEEKPIPRLRQLTTYPVAGIQGISEKIPATETELEKNTPTALYVAKDTGFIFKQSLVSTGEKKVSSLTIPNTHEALFNSTGTAVLFRYIKPGSETIETYSGKITSFSELSQINNIIGTFFPQNISSTAFLSNGTKLVYGIPSTLSGSIWTTSMPDGSDKKQALSSAFTEWLVEWPIEGKMFFTTKASGGILGFTYQLNTVSGEFNKVIGNIPGLTSKINQNGTLLIFNRSGETSTALNILDIAKQTVLQTGLQTLSDKCTWAKDMITVYCAVPISLEVAQYPDSWYQGLVSFSDSIWAINSNTGITKLVVNILSNESKEIDVTNIALDPEEKYLLFVNKKDGTAWSYRLDSSL
jgi:hypothetical protein